MSTPGGLLAFVCHRRPWTWSCRRSPTPPSNRRRSGRARSRDWPCMGQRGRSSCSRRSPGSLVASWPARSPRRQRSCPRGTSRCPHAVGAAEGRRHLALSGPAAERAVPGRVVADARRPAGAVALTLGAGVAVHLGASAEILPPVVAQEYGDGHHAGPKWPRVHGPHVSRRETADAPDIP